eukprot:m.66013 g.66013  ORF g.66013 m.66013 type:complete len:538 (-) comp11778_c0_seq2:58-1671(-)
MGNEESRPRHRNQEELDKDHEAGLAALKSARERNFGLRVHAADESNAFLPPEIIGCIFSHLSHHFLADVAARVCVLWRNCVTMALVKQVIGVYENGYESNIEYSFRKFQKENLVRACARGDVEEISWFLNEFQVDIRDCGSRVGFNPKPEEEPFSILCRGGHSDAAMMLTDKYDLCYDDVLGALGGCAINGHLDLVQWLVHFFGFEFRDIESSFAEICKNGHLDVAKWCADYYRCTTDDITDYENVILKAAGEGGHLEVVKWIIETFDIDINDIVGHDGQSGIIDPICYHGHLHVLQWIAQKFPINATKTSSFKYYYASACYCTDKSFESQKKRIEMLEWVVSHFDLKRDVMSLGGPLSNACQSGGLLVAQWLADTWKLTDDDGKKDLWNFPTVCQKGELEVAKWLVSRFNLSATEARYSNDSATRDASRYAHVQVVQWLILTFNIPKEDYLKESFSWALNSSCVELIAWVVSHYNMTADDLGKSIGSAFNPTHKNLNYPAAQWLVSHFNLTPDDFKDVYDYKTKIKPLTFAMKQSK